MPFGEVVEPLLLLVVEPRVARVAGDLRHPLSAPSSPLAMDSACSDGHRRGGLSLLSFSFRCRFALYAAAPRGGEELGESGGGAGKKGEEEK